MRILGLAIALAFCAGSAMAQPANRPAISGEDFQAGTTGALAKLCGASGTDAVATAAANGSVVLRHQTSGRTLLTLDGTSAVTALTFSPRADALVVRRESGAVDLFSLANPHPEVSWQALFGKVVKVGELRGKPLRSPLFPVTLVTTHPSALLRMPDEASREAAFEALVADLRLGLVTASRNSAKHEA